MRGAAEEIAERDGRESEIQGHGDEAEAPVTNAGADEVPALSIETESSATDDMGDESGLPRSEKNGFLSAKDGVYRLLNGRRARKVCGSQVLDYALRRNANGSGWILVLMARDMDGQLKRIEVSRGDLGNPTKISRDLADQGILVYFNMKDDLVDFLKQLEPTRREINFPYVGWVDCENPDAAFVTPYGSIGATNEETVYIYSPRGSDSLSESMLQKGDLADWQRYVAMPLKDNDLAVFLICFSLGVTLASLVGVEAGGVSIHGNTSSGKTTMGQCAASVWGSGVCPSVGEGKSMVRGWSSSMNGLEATASAHRGIVLILDELHLAPVQDLGAALYMLTTGEGKRSMNSDRSARETHKIRTGFISIGEMSMHEALARPGSPVYAGMLVRCADLPIAESTFASAEEADATKEACGRYYGTAGPAFVEYLQSAMRDSEDPWTLKNFRDALATYLPQVTEGLKLTSEGKRVAKRFALAAAAGEFAVAAGVLPFEEGVPTRAARALLHRWAANAVTFTDGQRAIKNIAAFIQKHKRRFCILDDVTNQSTSNQVGYHICGPRAADIGDHFYAFTDEGFREALGGCNRAAATKELKFRKLLRLDRDGKQPKLTVGGERVRAIWVSQRVLDQPEVLGD